jgi:hypothetical protein
VIALVSNLEAICPFAGCERIACGGVNATEAYSPLVVLRRAFFEKKVEICDKAGTERLVRAQ